MKFGKLLENATSGLPECDGLMLRYKQLKKQLKAMKASQPGEPARAAPPETTTPSGVPRLPARRAGGLAHTTRMPLPAATQAARASASPS
jgi:hypothetical protein